MKQIQLDLITFRLKEPHDFSWLKRYGRAFRCVDETGSGCICIGMEQADKRYFCKIAGVNTVEAEVTPQESVQILKNAVSLYDELKHPNLVKIIEAYEYDELYVAVDFYDGSILYDFVTDRVTICDIDLFRKKPAVNDRGMEWYGTKRLKAPEEYVKGNIIDEQTNIFTLGALIFDFFGTYSADEIKQRYVQNRFVPCSHLNWQLNEASYKVAEKAVRASRQDRYQTFEEFSNGWHKAVVSSI